ncbi:MAG: hypothetical protein MI974_29915 [Chitinophagales bacterium]|nr:hypothetical protein [Chitinophagales bacterium]
MLRLLSILSLLFFFGCQIQNEDLKFENLETLATVSDDHDDEVLAAKKKRMCLYLFIKIETDDPDLLDQTMCVCPSLPAGTCYSTGDLGWPFAEMIAIPISDPCLGFEEGDHHIVGHSDEAPFMNNNPTTIQLYVHVTDINTAYSSYVTYYPETNTFSLDNVAPGINIEVITDNFGFLC